MSRFRRVALASLTLALSCAAFAGAEVHVTVGFEPVELSAEAPAPPPDAAARVASAGGPMTLDSFWFVNYFEADFSEGFDATLWAVRNEGETTTDVEVTYFSTRAVPMQVENYEVPVRGVVTRTTRDVSGLTLDSDGFARGFIRIASSGTLSVDFFQVTASQDFATADLAATVDDFCEDLVFRFVDFGGARGSIASVLADIARGADPSDPPTLVGNVYDQGGNFINSFTVRTDENAFLLDIREFVLAGTLFGAIEVDASNAGGAIVFVSHSSEGRFSVSNAAVCRDVKLILL